MTKLGVTLGPSGRAAPLLARGASVGGVIAGKYRIERVIGHGGMGVVVAASHLALQRTVAIKLIRGDWADDPLAVERLVREARALASIQSQHVARVLDVGTLDDGIPFIVMEYLEGQDLDSLLRSDGPLPLTDAVDYLLQACEALAEAHRNGIVHRDIKPANLFVARQPGGVACIKVVDFGISKLINSTSVESLTHPSRIVGSLYHMAPEQLSGDPVDARTDVWALGVLLFELLTGLKPFQGGAWPAVCARVLSDTAPTLEGFGAHIPVEVQSVVRRCLQRMPEDRFSNVAELAVSLSPFGTRIARVSLEHIVRLATSTGSLAAEALSPQPPAPTARGGFEREPSLVGAERAETPAPQRAQTTPPPRWNTPAPPRGDAVGRDFPATDEPSGEALRLERRRSSAGHPSQRAVGGRRSMQWLVVAAAALVVISVPWLVTRLLRPAAPAERVVQASLPEAQRRPAQAPPSIVEASPALSPTPALPTPVLPGGVPAPSGVVASSGPILTPPGERLVPSPPPNNLPAAPAPAVSPLVRVLAAPSPAAPSPAAPSPAAPSPVAPSPVAPSLTAESPAAPSPARAAAEATGVAARANQTQSEAPARSAPAQSAASSTPRGANPWDFRDLEFE